MQPKLELKYGQRTGSTWVGRGWDLSLGAIEVDPSRAADGPDARYFHRSSEGPTRLLSAPSSEEYPCPDAECFWQERDVDRTRYRLSEPGDRPPYWVATDRSGRRYVFGRSAEARVSSPSNPSKVIHWALESIEDLLGNEIRIYYILDRGHAYPREITYSHHPDLPALYAVSFHTEATPGEPAGYSYGFERRLARRLAAVTVRADGHPFSAFQLEYRSAGAEEPDLLQSLQEFGADFVIDGSHVVAGTAFPPHRFEYDTSVPFSRVLRTELPTGDGELYGRGWTDFDGNGLADYCRLADGRAICDLYEDSGIRRVSLPVKDFGYSNSRAWVDYNNDGRSDFCRIVGNRGDFRIRCSPSVGDHFDKDYNSSVIGHEHEQLTRAWVDVNRDGFVDFCRATSKFSWPDLPTEPDLLRNAGPGRLKCTLGSANGFSAGTLALVGPEIEIGRTHGAAWIDVSGDRRPDFCRPIGWRVPPFHPIAQHDPALTSAPRTGTLGCIVNTPEGFRGTIESSDATDFGYLEGRAWADVNGDGLGDYCRVVSGSRVACAISNGTSLRRGLVLKARAGDKLGRTWADADGDGRAEYCRVITMAGGKASSCAALGRGDSTVEIRVASWLAEPKPETRTWTDADGDGFIDYCRQEPMAEGGSHYACMQRQRPSLNLLTAQVTPLGRHMEISYERSTSNLLIPLVTLAQTTTLDEWGWVEVRFSFADGRWDYARNEFAGFAAATAVKLASGDRQEIVSRTEFEQGLGDAARRARRGLPLRIRVGLDDDAVSTTTIDYVGDPAPPYATPVRSVESASCEAGRCRLGLVEYEHDLFANVVHENHRSESLAGTQLREISRRFQPNPAAWILGLPSEESLVDADGRVLTRTRWSYDGDSLCSGTESESATPTRGLLTKTRRWVAGEEFVDTEQGYGRAGQLTCKRDGRGAVTSFRYDEREAFVVGIEGPERTDDGATAPQMTTTSYLAGVNAPLAPGEKFGTAVRTVDARGGETRRAFDALGRLTSESRPGRGTRGVEYLDLGVVGEQRVTEHHSAGVSSTTWFDSSGRPRRVEEGPVGGETRFRDLSYDSAGNLVVETDPYRKGEVRRLAQARYDPVGRLTESVSPSGASSLYCYAPGVEVVVLPGGRKVRRTLTPEGELLQIEEFAGSFASCDVGDAQLAAAVRVSRDAAGRATEVVDAETRRWFFSYDGLGRTTSLITPDSGQTQWAWDDTGNVSQVTTQTGAWSMTYDALGRLQSRRATDFKGSSTAVSYRYDGAQGGIGLPWITSNGEVEVEIAQYDPAGRAVGLEKRVGNSSFRFERTIDELGRLRELRDPDGISTTYDYEGRFLARIEHAGQEILSVAERDFRGRPTSLDYADGIRRSVRYCDEAKGSPACHQKVEQEGRLLFEERLFFDPQGNVRGVQDPLRGNRLYAFDDLGRLVNEHNERGQRFWSYDASGNRIFDSAHGDAIYEPGTSRLRQLGEIRLEYDPAGRVVNRGDYKIAYRPDGQVQTITGRNWQTTYNHDPEGGLIGTARRARGLNRVCRWLTGKPTRIVTLMPGFGYRCVDGECSRRIFAGGLRVATSSPSGLRFDFQDYRGSLVTTAGTEERQFSYDAFGATRPKDHGEGASFAGYQADPMWPGLYFANARFYDAELGRFLTPDPLTGLGFSSQGPNRYAYALNNPVTLIDPTGELPGLIVAIIVGAAIGAAAGGIMAAIRGENVWAGMLRGAFYGGLMGAVGYFAAPSIAGNLGPLVRVVGGAASGWATSQVFGGDPALGAVLGAVGAIGGMVTQGSEVSFFGDSQTNAWANLANQLATDARNGAIRGLVLGTFMGMDPLEAAAYGAIGGMVGGQAPNLIGHLYGLAFGVIGTGEWPAFRQGAWYYKIDNWGMRDGAAVTIGNVIGYDNEAWGDLMIDHEMIHVGDWRHQGMGFAVGYLTSMPFVGLIDQQHVYESNPYEPIDHDNPSLGNDVGKVPSGPFGSRW